MRRPFSSYSTIVLLLAVALGQSAAIQAEMTEPLRLADLIAEARQHNPEIRAARERTKAMAAIPARVSAYDDPTFSYEAWNTPNSLRIDQADNNIFRLSQKIPFPGKRTLDGQVAEGDAEVARREAEMVELDVIAAVKRAYYDLWMVQQNLLTYSRDKALVQRLAHIAEQRYATSQVSQADVLRAQFEVTHLITRVTTETLAIESARAELSALLSRGADKVVGTPTETIEPGLEGTAEQLTELALRQRPELAAQAAAIARAERAIERAQRNYLPDFEVSVGRFVNYGQNDGFGAMASVSIPFVFKAKYDAAVVEASARLAAAKTDLRRLQDRVRREVEQAFLRTRTAILQHDLLVTTHIPQAEQTLRVTESAYETGTVDFPTLIDGVRAIESTHLEHIEAAATFEKAYADLERAVGGDLSRGSER